MLMITIILKLDSDILNEMFSLKKVCGGELKNKSYPAGNIAITPRIVWGPHYIVSTYTKLHSV